MAEKNTDKLKLRLSASRVGGHFEHGCQRFTAYSVLMNPEKAGWSERTYSHNSSQDAGHIWEWDALCLLEDRGFPCYAERCRRDDSKNTERVTDFRQMRKLCNVYEEKAEYRYTDLSPERTIEILKDPGAYLPEYENEGGYIYQTTLLNQDTFTESVLLSGSRYRELLKQVYSGGHPLLSAEWSFCKPDLIYVTKDKDGENVFSIVDMKHAGHARMSHKVQVAIYAVMLSTLLEQEKIPGRVDMETGYLWNFKREAPLPFDMSVVIPFVNKYFSEDMPAAIAGLVQCREDEKNEADVYNRAFKALPTVQCEWCENYKSCMKYQQEHEPVTLIPYLSYYAQVYAKKNAIPLDIDGFEKYISDDENLTSLKEGCLGWKRVLSSGAQNIQALREMKEKMEKLLSGGGDREIFAAPVSKNVSSLIMPAGEKLRIILTAQRDEATDRVYALGISAGTKIEEILPENNGDNNGSGDKEKSGETENSSGYHRFTGIFIAEKPEKLDENIREFMECLYGILQRCDEYNQGSDLDFNDKLTVQAYVMDNYEQINLTDTIMDELLNGDGVRDADYREKLLAILFWLMGERMVTDVEEQADSLKGDFPLVVISSVVRSLFCIPAYISYDLETVCDAMLGNETERKEFSKGVKYDRILSNTMKSDAINLIWANKAKDEEKELRSLRGYLSIRLNREFRLVSAIRKKSDGSLKRWPEAFAFSGMNESLSIRAAKLITQMQYEEILQYHDIRQIRMNDPDEMAGEGRIMKARLISQSQINKKTYNKYPAPRELPGFICKCEILNKDEYFQRDFFRGILLKAGDNTAWEELSALNQFREKNNIIPNVTMDKEYNPVRNLYVVDSIKTETDSSTGSRTVSFERFKGFEEVEKGITADALNGTEFYLVNSYKDLNTEKVNTALCNEGRHYDDTDPGDKHSLLYPETIYRKEAINSPNNGEEVPERKLSEEDLKECLSFKPEDRGRDFTDSQSKAFSQMFFKNITLLLGPPGTGKTDFVARAVITLCRYYFSKGVIISVLLSANSHSAINNILSALVQKEEGKEGEPVICKLESWGDDGADPVNGVRLVKDYPPDDEMYVGNLYRYEEGRPFVLGATCWKIGNSVKRFNDSNSNMFEGFDLVVIDEASQMRSMDALIVLQQAIAAPMERFLIVGDEDQLSPVLHGKYDASAQEVDFYGSVFRLYYDTAKKYSLDYLVPLEEQFRMNEILSRYPAQAIYDRDIREGDGRKGYHAFDFDKGGRLGIAAQQLTLKDFAFPGFSGDAADEEQLMGLLADPEYPLIVCRIHDGDAKEKRDEEIRLVTLLIGFLREHMCVPGTEELYGSDEEFWGSSNGEGGVGIISPHHEQINRLKDALASENGMDRDRIFIGTVDTLQGRQREAVIVSYGMTDPEKAELEMEFIYSRNRLNVAMTRGKKKTICFLSDTLLDRNAETLSVDDDIILKGIDYMTGLLDFMNAEEEDTRTDNRLDLMTGKVRIDVFRKRMKTDTIR
ncbi:MAG: AAA family ATPase [Lachnospiraceae bacterium]|nr:AAA family ATPase [Lachnospiraceae bacterium]